MRDYAGAFPVDSVVRHVADRALYEGADTDFNEAEARAGVIELAKLADIAMPQLRELHNNLA